MHHESIVKKGTKIKLNTRLRRTGMRVEKVKVNYFSRGLQIFQIFVISYLSVIKEV